MELQKELYFTIAEACKKYNISRSQFRKICNRKNVKMVENAEVYFAADGSKVTLTSTYVKRIDFIKAVI